MVPTDAGKWTHMPIRSRVHRHIQRVAYELHFAPMHTQTAQHATSYAVTLHPARQRAHSDHGGLARVHEQNICARHCEHIRHTGALCTRCSPNAQYTHYIKQDTEYEFKEGKEHNGTVAHAHSLWNRIQVRLGLGCPRGRVKFDFSYFQFFTFSI